MFRETVARQLNTDRELGPVKDICVVVAQRTYLARKDSDTDPMIVQMILHGQLVPHWYYRSKEWIEQPYYLPSHFLQPYCGPANQVMPVLYGEGTYESDEELIRLTERGIVVK